MNNVIMDKRIFSREKLATTAPLPYISRRSLSRVRNPLPIPTECCHCGGEVKLYRNKVVYGRSFGDWPYVYGCMSCDARVGLHPHTDLPLGTLANKEERQARAENKVIFERLRTLMPGTRKEAYAWLAGKMGMDASECHWSMFGIDLSKKAGAICQAELERIQ